MNKNASDRDILFEFESIWNFGRCPVSKFIDDHARNACAELKLALIRLETKLKLLSGHIPKAAEYVTILPECEEQLFEVIAEEVLRFCEKHRPIEGALANLPQMVGDYQVIKCVGRDSISVHYDAIQTSLARKVRLRTFLFPTDSFSAKARLIAKIEHPNTENYIDFCKHGNVRIIVTQMESGENLAELVGQKHKQISPRRAVAWVRAIGKSLVELHRCGIAHLNISLNNIVVRDDGDAVLTNTFLENPFAADYPCDVIPKKLNPFPYRSFECSQRNSRSCFDSDTTALGIVLFQLLTGLGLQHFFNEDPLPAEPIRLKKLIADQLECLEFVDEELKCICHRATLGLMDGQQSYHVEEFVSELANWEQKISLGHEAQAEITPQPTSRMTMNVMSWLGI